MNERLRFRLGWRSSNATAPRRNRFRESKVNPPWLDDDWHDLCTGEELAEDEGEQDDGTRYLH